MQPLLEVEALEVSYLSGEEHVEALRGVDLCMDAGEGVGLVGRSGSGKSSLGLALMGLLPAAARVRGRMNLAGEELLESTPSARRDLCGRMVSMVFQEPATALNPVMRVGKQIREALRRRQGWHRKDEAGEVGRLLRQVELEPALATAYPHQLSGGQRQRVLIAIAIAPSPRLLVADEPTTALDTVTEVAILELLSELRRSMGLAVLLISHDLRAASRLCDRALVLDEGQVVERGDLKTIMTRPHHAQTRALVAALRDPAGEGRFAHG